MADFRGIEDFVAAVTGGSGYEQAGYDAATERLIKQRSAQAQLDKRLEEAAMAKRENEAGANLGGLIVDPKILELTLSKLGSSYSGAMSGEQTRMQNDTMQQAMAALQGSTAANAPVPADLINALSAIGGQKMLAPTNVQVQRQATSDLGVSNSAAAENAAQAALAAARQKAVENPVLGSTAATVKPVDIENLTQDQMSLLVEETKAATPSTLGFGGSEAEYKDLYPEFLQFQMDHITTDPNMADGNYALAKFLAQRNAPAAASGVPEVSGASVAPASPNDVVRFVRDVNGNLVIAQ